jgi:replicative DNA helicase
LTIKTYLDKGWSVIPVKADKTPAIDSWKEYQTRLPSLDEAAKWERGNIAVVTGKVSGLVVVDADNQQAVDWCLSSGLASPLRVRSGRSDMAMHFYFKHPGVEVKSVNSVIHDGVDIKADPGYVILPPSIHQSGRPYRWINGYAINPPLFPIDRFKSLLKGPTAPTGINLSPVDEVSRIAEVEAALKALSPRRADDYDTWIKVGMALKEFGTVGLRLWAEWSKRSSKYDESAILTKWASFKEQGNLTIGTILAWAREDGAPSQGRQGSSIFTPTASGLETHKQRLFGAVSVCEFKTGFKLLDQYVRLRRGEISTIAARTSIGKTSIAIKIACELCSQGKRVLFCTTEMSTDTILERFVSILSGVSTASSRIGTYTDDERLLLSGAYDKIEGFGDRLQICDQTSPTIEQVQRYANISKPDLIIFDHLQHVSGATGDSRYDISKFVRGLKDLAREKDCPVLALSQIRRLGKDKQGKELEPGLSDLKESGTIEEESAQVVILSIVSGEDNDDKIVVAANVAKNRFGPKLRIGLAFDRPTVTFSDLELDNANPKN